MAIMIEDLPTDEELSEDDLSGIAGGAAGNAFLSPFLTSTSWALKVDSTSYSSGWVSSPMVATENATAGVRG